jgi:hypothetical protein
MGECATAIASKLAPTNAVQCGGELARDSAISVHVHIH